MKTTGGVFCVVLSRAPGRQGRVSYEARPLNIDQSQGEVSNEPNKTKTWKVNCISVAWVMGTYKVHFVSGCISSIDRDN